MQKKSIKSYIWSNALYGCERWTVTDQDKTRLSLKCSGEEEWKQSAARKNYQRRNSRKSKREKADDIYYRS